MLELSMGEKRATNPTALRQYNRGLLNTTIVLAVVSAIFHLYIALVDYGVPLGVPLILIALVYLGGAGMIAMNYKRDLWIKVAIGWVVLVIALWALSAAVNAPFTRDPLALADKAVEFVLLGVLLRMWSRSATSSAPK